MRCITMLKLIPCQPKRIGTSDLLNRLTKQGFDVSQRTIQRDLRELQGLFPGLQCDGNRDQAGWFWDGKEICEFPAMDAYTAFAFRLMDAFMVQMLPLALLEELSPYRKAAQRVLDSLPPNNGLFAWENKVRIMPVTQPLRPARINIAARRAVYQALFEDRCFRGRSRRRGGDVVEYELNPLGLVFEPRVVYLVATVGEYDDPRQFALHRFLDAQLSNKPSRAAPDFSLEAYCRQGAFEYVDDLRDNLIVLKARFCNEAAVHLRETPLAEDQVIEDCPQAADWCVVSATVRDSRMLRWWLLGFGDGVEVLEPESLRGELGDIARNMAAYYGRKS